MAIILVAHVPGNPVTEFIPARFGPSDAAEMFVFCSGFASAIAFGGTFAPGRLRARHAAHRAPLLADLLVASGAVRHRRRTVRGRERPAGRDRLCPRPLAAAVLRRAAAGAAPPGDAHLRAELFRHSADVHGGAGHGARPSWRWRGFGPAAPLAACITLYLAQLARGWDLPAEWWSDRPWFFDPFAWQLLFFAGFAFASGWLPAPPQRRWLLWLAAAFVSAAGPGELAAALGRSGVARVGQPRPGAMGRQDPFRPAPPAAFPGAGLSGPRGRPALALAAREPGVPGRWPPSGSRPCRCSCGACASPRCSAWRSTRPGAGR